jgi:lysophospholipase L1-like esterase
MSLRNVGPLLVGAVLGSLPAAFAANAAAHAAPATWIGTWGYVSLPPPPGEPIPVAATAPTPTAPPMGGFTPSASLPARPPAPPVPPAIDNPGNLPVDLISLDQSNVTVRQAVRVSQGGARLRLRFSNENGAADLPLGAVHIAAAGVDGTVVPGSDHVVTFDGRPSVILPAGAPVLSDPVDLSTQALERLYISTYLPGTVPTHSPRYLVQYVAGKPGDQTGAETLPAARLMQIPPYVTLVEVQTTVPTGVVVALGDSITQGRGATANAFRGWPDRLAERLAPHHWAVVNAGIGGNRLLRYGLGPNALARLDRDVLSVPGLKAIIVMEGINDIGVGLRNAAATEQISAEALEAADRQLIARAHEHGIRIIGATLTPYEGSFYASPAGEMVREALNHWIRSSGEFDGVIDFAPAVADPANPLAIDRRYNESDHLHPNDAGYQAMADAIDLSVIVK